MPRKITVNIEMKPYLVKFLIKSSINHELPLKFPRKHPYNVSLLNKVSNYYRQSSFPIQDRDDVLSYFVPNTDASQNACIILPFSTKKNILSYNYLSRANKIAFRKEVRDDFNLAFHRYLVRYMRKGMHRTEILARFMNSFGLSENDIKFESLYRYSTRLLEDLC